jgi:hypothetical protein
MLAISLHGTSLPSGHLIGYGRWAGVNLWVAIKSPMVSHLTFALIVLKWIFVDYDQFALQTFVKDDVYKALRLGHTQARDDAKLFTKLRNAEKVRAWIREPDGQYSARFKDMKIPEFRAYLKAKREIKGKGKSAGVTEGKGKKRERSKASGDESEPVKAKKGKGKAVDSDALDDSEEDT